MDGRQVGSYIGQPQSALNLQCPCPGQPFNTKPLSITADDVSIELYSEGMIICGDTWTPTESELGQLPWLILTSPHDWDPHNICFLSCGGQLSDNTPIESSHSILAVDTLLQHTIYNPMMVASLMSLQVQVAEIATPSALQDVPLCMNVSVEGAPFHHHSFRSK